MTAKFTNKIRNFVASSLIDNLSQQQINEWTSLTNYIEGTLVFYGNNKYIAKQTGQSGLIPPTHVNGTASDGSISWIWVEYINTNQMFKRNLFIGIGKNTEWADENTPDEIDVNDLTDYQVIKNLIAIKKISGNNFRLAIKRHNWATGTIYSQYDDNKDPLAISGDSAYAHPFFVFTDENNIYKCINNNNDAQSTSKPTDIGTVMFNTADGYVWKYMGSLDADAVYFLSSDFVPVRYKIENDSTNQWDVQQAAVKLSLSTFKILASAGTFPTTMTTTVFGGNPTTAAEAYAVKDSGDNTLKQILVNSTEVGTGYDLNEKVYARVQRTGVSGTGGTVGTITVTDGVITNITVGNAGSNYTSGAILLLYDPDRLTPGVGDPPRTDADIDVEISVGNNIESFTINDGGSYYSNNVMGFIIAGENGGIGEAVFAPKEGHGFNIITELCANTAIINTRLSEGGSYFPTGEDNAFRQISLVTDVVDKLTLTPAFNQLYIGPSHDDYVSGSQNKIDSNKGYVLYVNNLKKVVRDSGQEEDLKMAISF